MIVKDDTRNCCFAITFANGTHVIDTRKQTPVRVRAVRRIEDGDWKTQSVRQEFMGLKAHEEGILEERWQNLYGLWYRVRRADGNTVDCKATDLHLIADDEVDLGKMSFIALCLIGKEEPENIDDYIEKWHTMPEDGQPLHTYLGFTKPEYSSWLSSKNPPFTLSMILRCR